VKTRLRPFAALAIVGLVLVSGSAQAGESEPRATMTTGWAGYVVRTVTRSFAEVAGSWVQPRVVCSRPGSSAAFWVGLGGASSDSMALEQVGTSADCSQRALVSYSAWYQLFPAPPVELPLMIRPGDTVAARVAVDASTVTIELRDVSTGASFSTELRMRSPETDSAEWIVEAPSACFTTCAQLPLAAFRRIIFADNSTTSGAHSGSIGDPGWSKLRLTMRPHGGRSAAVPTSLSANGSSFSVKRLP
jgi:peptidase A4-like protein